MDWFPDWTGQTCAVLACGPSAAAGQAWPLRGRCKTIAVNLAWWHVAPWADALYACDPNWWASTDPGYGQHALAAFPALKVGQWNRNSQGEVVQGHAHPDLRLVEVRRENRLIPEPGVIGGGDHSGFQALNLAVQFGCRRVLLLGFDMHGENGRHCHRDHKKPMGNPHDGTWNRWIGAWHDAEADIRAAGVEVINCTPRSALKLFPMMSAEEALCQEPVS